MSATAFGESCWPHFPGEVASPLLRPRFPLERTIDAFAVLAYIAAVKSETLGRTIKHVRTQAGYTLRGFAEMVGISAAYLSDIEHDRRNPTDEVLRKIAAKLRQRVPVTYEELRARSTRLETDLQEIVQQTPEVGQLLREVKETGRPVRDVLRELQQHLRNTHPESDEE